MVQGNSPSPSLMVEKELDTIFLNGSLVTGIKSHKIVPALKTLQFHFLKLAPRKQL